MTPAEAKLLLHVPPALLDADRSLLLVLAQSHLALLGKISHTAL